MKLGINISNYINYSPSIIKGCFGRSFTSTNIKVDLNKSKKTFFDHDVICTNTTVKLRPINSNDKTIFAQFSSNDKIWKYFACRMCSIQDMNDYIDQALAQRKLGLRYHFAIENKVTGMVVGSTAFGNYSKQDSRIEVGWTWLDTIAQGSGINQNTKFLLLNFAFEYLDIKRVEFKTDALNQQARSALLKIGATEEGILRSHTLMPDGRYRDTVYYSILKDEWNIKLKLQHFAECDQEVHVLAETSNFFSDCESLC